MGRIANASWPAIAVSTILCWSGSSVSGSAGSARNESKPNHRLSSCRELWRERHHLQRLSLQASSRRRRTSPLVPGNWWRTHGGITDFPPDTEIQAIANASTQPCSGASAIACRSSDRHASPSRHLRIASLALDTLGAWAPRNAPKNRSKPTDWRARVVSQCQASCISVGTSRNASH